MPTKHKVVKGDCIESIASKYGHFPKTVWDDPDNSELKEQRDSAVLSPGDVVVIPDKRESEVDVATGQRHRFRRRGVPSRFQVDLDVEEMSLDGLDYTLDFDGGAVTYKGTLDESGQVDHPMPPEAQHAKLFVGDGESRLVFEFDLGQLDVVETRDGLVGRLRGLGFLEDTKDVTDERLAAALKRFQEENSIEPTGKPDDATRKALVDTYGC